MIYLIDDNQNNQRENEYGIDLCKNGVFSNYLTNIEKIKKTNKADDVSNLLFLENADCLLVHSTTEDVDGDNDYIKGSISNVTKIKELVSEEGQKVPLVLFSNKMDENALCDFNKNPNYVRAIKKNKFYERLSDFLTHYQLTGKVELRIIAFGKNFIAVEILNYAKELLLNVAFKKETDPLNITDISSLQTFRSFIKAAGLEERFDEILISLEDNPITVKKFRENINLISESFIKYGKNIFNWS